MATVHAAAQALGCAVEPDAAGSEASACIATAVRAILLSLGADVDAEGMKDTPHRVAKMWQELTVGYRTDPAEVLETRFSSGHYDEMITLGGIGFHSTCEHHLLPFSGVATVGYIPRDGRVVGISKLARLVDCFARRFQIQERMTKQIADALEKHLQPLGAGVQIRATHLCMVCRGVAKPDCLMTTTSLTGRFREDPACRAEFLGSVG
jgi:GTP cyclohydrolase I